jgi:NAD(P)H dehydrogenase (quinone)
MAVGLAVVYCSATGNVRQFAEALARGAEGQGAGVRLRRAPELAPDTAVDANPAWRAHVDATKNTVPEADPGGPGVGLGLRVRDPDPVRQLSSQLEQFIDSTGGLWQAGVLHDNPSPASPRR